MGNKWGKGEVKNMRYKVELVLNNPTFYVRTRTVEKAIVIAQQLLADHGYSINDYIADVEVEQTEDGPCDNESNVHN